MKKLSDNEIFKLFILGGEDNLGPVATPDERFAARAKFLKKM